MAAPSTPASPRVYRDELRGWQLAIPPGWTQLPDSVVKLMHEEAARTVQDASAFIYLTAFIRDPSQFGTEPHVLVQFTPTPLNQATRAELAKALSALDSSEIQRQLKQGGMDLLGHVAPGQFILEDGTNRLLGSLDIDPPGQPELSVRARIVGFPTKAGIVQLNFYDYPKRTNGISMPESDLDSFVRGVSIDPDRVWTPARMPSGINWRGVGFSALVGAVAALAVFGISRWIKRA